MAVVNTADQKLTAGYILGDKKNQRKKILEKTATIFFFIPNIYREMKTVTV